VHDVGSLIIAALTLLAIVLGSASSAIRCSGRIRCGRFFNLVLSATACRRVAAALALRTRETRPRGYSMTAAVSRSLSRSPISRSRCARSSTATCSRGGTAMPSSTPIRCGLAFGVALLAVGIALRAQSPPRSRRGGPHHPQVFLHRHARPDRIYQRSQVLGLASCCSDRLFYSGYYFRGGRRRRQFRLPPQNK